MNYFTEDEIVRCKLCGKVNPQSCHNPDCPMEDYFWSLEDGNNE